MSERRGIQGETRRVGGGGGGFGVEMMMMMSFLEIGLAPVVMSSEQEARLSVCCHVNQRRPSALIKREIDGGIRRPRGR